MTDEDIRAELELAKETGGGITRLVEVDSPADGPPLIIQGKMFFSREGMARLRAAWEDAWRGDRRGPGPRLIVLDGDLKVHQLIDGVWRELGGAPTRPDA